MAILDMPPNVMPPAIVAQVRADAGPPVVVLEKKAPKASGALLTNGDFSKGLEGWTSFKTDNGEVLETKVVSFAVKSGKPTKAVAMAVGQRDVRMVPNKETGGKIMDHTREGGGIEQEITVASPTRLMIRVPVASEFVSTEKHVSNGDGGLFELLIDGKEVAKYSVDSVVNHRVARGVLEATVELTPGKHQLGVRVTRGTRPSLLEETDAKGKIVKQVTLRCYVGGVEVRLKPAAKAP